MVGTNVGAEFVHELVDTELIGIVGIEVRIKRIEMVAQNRLGRLYAFEQRNRPRPGTRPGMRIADVGRKHVPSLDLRPRTKRLLSRRSSLFRAGSFDLFVAPLLVPEFSVVSK